jgi:membrane fusion protein, multidrug efflux system
MKILFRAAVIILLIAILAAVLFRKKQQVTIETTNAKMGNYEIPVHTSIIQSAQPELIITASGIVESSEEVMVVSTVLGQLTAVNVAVGKKFNKNEVLATVDDFYAAQEYKIAGEAAHQLEKDLKRYEKLAEEDAVAKQQLEQIRLQYNAADTKQKLLLKRVEDTRIKAPLNGVINQVFVKKGATIATGTPICEIVNPEGLKISVHVEKNDLRFLKPGTLVNLGENSGQGIKFPGIITGVGVKPDRSGRFPVSISTTGTSKELKPGTVLYAEISVTTSPSIVVPRKLIVIRNGLHGIFISENNIAVFKQVETGKDFENNVEVITGIEEGMVLITDGYQFLEQGNKVKPAM